MADWQNYDPTNNILPTPNEMTHLLEDFKAAKTQAAEVATPAKKRVAWSKQARIHFITPIGGEHQPRNSHIAAMPALDEAELTEANMDLAADTFEETGDSSPMSLQGSPEQQWSPEKALSIPESPIHENEAESPAVKSPGWSSWAVNKLVSTPMRLLGRKKAKPVATNSTPEPASEYNLDYQEQQSPSVAHQRRLFRPRRPQNNGQSRLKMLDELARQKMEAGESIGGMSLKIDEEALREQARLEFEKEAESKREEIRMLNLELEATKRKAAVAEKVKDFEMRVPRRIAPLKRRKMIELYEFSASTFAEGNSYGIFEQDPEYYEEMADFELRQEEAKKPIPSPAVPAEISKLPRGWDNKEWTKNHGRVHPDYEPTPNEFPYDPLTVDWVTGERFSDSTELAKYQSSQDTRLDPYTGRIFKDRHVLLEFQNLRRNLLDACFFYSRNEDSYTLKNPCYHVKDGHNIFDAQGAQGSMPVFFYNLSYLPEPDYKMPARHKNYDGSFPDEPPKRQRPQYYAPATRYDHEKEYDDVTRHWSTEQDHAYFCNAIHPYLGYPRQLTPGTFELTPKQKAIDEAEETKFRKEFEKFKNDRQHIPDILMKQYNIKIVWQNAVAASDDLPKPKPSETWTLDELFSETKPATASKPMETTDPAQIGMQQAAETPKTRPATEGSVTPSATSLQTINQGQDSNNIENSSVLAEKTSSSSGNIFATPEATSSKVLFNNPHKPSQASKLKNVWVMSPVQNAEKDKQNEKENSTPRTILNPFSQIATDSYGFEIDLEVQKFLDSIPDEQLIKCALPAAMVLGEGEDVEYNYDVSEATIKPQPKTQVVHLGQKVATQAMDLLKLHNKATPWMIGESGTAVQPGWKMMHGI